MEYTTFTWFTSAATVPSAGERDWQDANNVTIAGSANSHVDNYADNNTEYLACSLPTAVNQLPVGADVKEIWFQALLNCTTDDGHISRANIGGFTDYPDAYNTLLFDATTDLVEFWRTVDEWGLDAGGLADFLDGTIPFQFKCRRDTGKTGYPIFTCWYVFCRLGYEVTVEPPQPDPTLIHLPSIF